MSLVKVNHKHSYVYYISDWGDHNVIKVFLKSIKAEIKVATWMTDDGNVTHI